MALEINFHLFYFGTGLFMMHLVVRIDKTVKRYLSSPLRQLPDDLDFETMEELDDGPFAPRVPRLG